MAISASAARVDEHVTYLRQITDDGGSRYPYAFGVVSGLVNPRHAAPLPDAEVLRRIREVLHAIELTDPR